MTDIGDNTIDLINCKKIAQSDFENLKKNGCQPIIDDILLSKDGTIGRAAVVKNNGFVALSSLGILSPNKKYLNSIYCRYYLISSINKDQMYSYIQGSALTRITIGIIDNLLLVHPPLFEQTTIACFLDQKTALIDRIISNRHKQIELLKEERKAVINQAVTKGINPNAKLKPSGIEWLGDIPEHWNVVKLKYLIIKIGSGVTPKGGAEVYQKEGIPILRSQNVHFDGLKLNGVAFISREIHNQMSNSKVMGNDLLLNITGASIGRCYYIPNGFGDANVNQHVCIIRPNSKLDTKFLHYSMSAVVGQKQIDISQTGASREVINFEQLKNFLFPKVSIKEQHSIVAHIEEKITHIDTIISKQKRQISLLEEYRTSLISKAVTGQIDVRDWQPSPAKILATENEIA